MIVVQFFSIIIVAFVFTIPSFGVLIYFNKTNGQNWPNDLQYLCVTIRNVDRNCLAFVNSIFLKKDRWELSYNYVCGGEYRILVSD